MLPYQNPKLDIETRVKDLLSRMTLEEKVAQTTMIRGVEYASRPDPRQHCSVLPDTEFDEGKLSRDIPYGIGYVHDMYSLPEAQNRIQKYFVEKTRLGIPVAFTGEALHGISGVRGTIFPVPLNLGATFDPDLVKEVGGAIGRESRALGIHEILAPNLDVAREPRWGRVEETFGEDTYLSSRMAAAIIQGEQKGDIGRPDAVISEPKHFCTHGMAEAGTNCSNARAGEREIERDYLPVFEAAITEGGAKDVMVCYNAIDGEPMMCHPYYLKTVLKDRMKLQGIARSDWGGVKRLVHDHHVAVDDKDAIRLAVLNGLDVQGCCDYSATFWIDTLIDLVREGSIPESRIDDIASRVLTMKYELGLFDRPYTDETLHESVIRCEDHLKTARKAAAESIVLLKNDGVLPLKNVKSLALIGPSSASQKIGGYSSIPTGYEIPSVYRVLKEMLPDAKIRQCSGCAITHEDGPRIVDGQPHLFSEAEKDIGDELDEAVRIASECEIIVFVGGDNTITSGEGRDRCTLDLYGRQKELLEKLHALGKPLILVLENGKQLELSQESRICNAMMMTFFGGSEGAYAIADALLGKTNVFGKLPVSLPRDSTRIPCYYTMLPGGAGDYLEGPKNALYPFGFGLSYTTFSYSDLSVRVDGPARATVTLKVRNTGPSDGDEVVEIYVTDVVASVVTPPAQLKAFRRVSLRSGEEKELSFTLDENAFRVFSVNKKWEVEPGDFRISVGTDSRSFVLSQTIRL